MAKKDTYDFLKRHLLFDHLTGALVNDTKKVNFILETIYLLLFKHWSYNF
jgi:hypothetical protein